MHLEENDIDAEDDPGNSTAARNSAIEESGNTAPLSTK